MHVTSLIDGGENVRIPEGAAKAEGDEGDEEEVRDLFGRFVSCVYRICTRLSSAWSLKKAAFKACRDNDITHDPE